jgi:hypothetical protein
MAFNGLLLLAAIVRMAGAERVAYPFQHFIIEAKLPEQLGKQRIALPIWASGKPSYPAISVAAILKPWIQKQR